MKETVVQNKVIVRNINIKKQWKSQFSWVNDRLSAWISPVYLLHGCLLFLIFAWMKTYEEKRSTVSSRSVFLADHGTNWWAAQCQKAGLSHDSGRIWGWCVNYFQLVSRLVRCSHKHARHWHWINLVTSMLLSRQEVDCERNLSARLMCLPQKVFPNTLPLFHS